MSLDDILTPALRDAIQRMDIQEILRTLSHDSGAWGTVVLALIPFCILLFIRELCCWFLKTNQQVRYLRRIERHMRTQGEFFEEQLRRSRERTRTASSSETLPREEPSAVSTSSFNDTAPSSAKRRDTF